MDIENAVNQESRIEGKIDDRLETASRVFKRLFNQENISEKLKHTKVNIMFFLTLAC